MNDGYIAVMLLLSFAIMLATGWGGPLLGGKPSVLLLLAWGAALLAAPLTVTIGEHSIAPAALPPLVWACARLLGARPTVRALWLQAAGLLLLTLWLWTDRQGTDGHASATIVRESWLGPLLCGAAAAAVAERPQLRTALLIAVASGAGIVSYSSHSGSTPLFGWAWRDAVALALLSGYVSEAVLRLLKAAMRSGGPRRSRVRFGEEGGEPGA